eukprot:scaffold1542_cov402-Prasinococcus_capsulatus_cf.AAC.12
MAEKTFQKTVPCRRAENAVRSAHEVRHGHLAAGRLRWSPVTNLSGVRQRKGATRGGTCRHRPQRSPGTCFVSQVYDPLTQYVANAMNDEGIELVPSQRNTELRGPSCEGGFGGFALFRTVSWATVGQVCFAALLTACVGAILQLTKLVELDASGRQFFQSTYASKVSFLLPFAICKALSNLLVGFLADKYGRKPSHMAGWLIGLVGPCLCLVAPSNDGGWALVVISNIFLGIQQGLCWSVCVFIFIDLFGPGRSGVAIGICESMGYSFVALAALLYPYLESAWVQCEWSEDSTNHCSHMEYQCKSADDWDEDCLGECVCTGYTKNFSYVQIAISLFATVVALVFLRESMPPAGRKEPALQRLSVDHDGEDAKLLLAGEEASVSGNDASHTESVPTCLAAEDVKAARSKCSSVQLAWHFSSRDRPMIALMICGFLANGMTGLVWGLLPSWVRDTVGLSGSQRDTFQAIYSFTKGLSQFLTGLTSDFLGRWTIASIGLNVSVMGLVGFFLISLMADSASNSALYLGVCTASSVVGLGTGVSARLCRLRSWVVLGIIYPVLPAAVADNVSDHETARAVGVYRFWRDLGYVGGAAVALGADSLSVATALGLSALAVAGGTAYFMFYYQERRAW